MYQKFKLKNGLKLILAPLKETKAMTILVLLPAGSRYERKEINGVSHFIEHMAFKGTKKRPSSLDITKELDSVGAEYNAFTTKDRTGYYIKTSADKIELAFDILSDILFYSLIDSRELEKERGVILEEINMYQDNPLLYIEHLFEGLVFGSHPLGWMISGNSSVIKKITREQIFNFKDNFYQPSNLVLTVAGKFEKQKVKQLIEKYFNLPKSKKIKGGFKKFKLIQKRPQLNLHFKETEQAHLCLGFPAYSFFDKREYALGLLSIILGGNMSSRLFIEIREKQGLAYFIQSTSSAYHDSGVLVVQAGLDKKRIDLAIRLILQELKKIRKEGVREKELKSAREFLKGRLILELEDSESVAHWYGRQQLLQNQILTPQQKLKKFFAVTTKDIQKVAWDIIKPEKLNLALIGPFKEKKEFLKLLKF